MPPSGETQNTMKNQDKKTEQLYEQFRVGVALAETARFTADKKVAVVLAKQGLALVAESAAAFMNDPEDWCPTRPKFPKKGPWPRPNWWLDIVDPLLDPDYEYRFNTAEVLGMVQTLKGNIESPQLKSVLQEVAKEAYVAIEA